MKTVFTCGTFDLFHIGHLNYLKQAKSFGDYLVVGVNTDEFTLSYKNKLPIIPFKDRFEIVKSCKYVDDVVLSEEFYPLKYIKEYNISVLVITSEFKSKEIDSVKWSINNNIDVKYINRTSDVSTTEIIKNICTKKLLI